MQLLRFSKKQLLQKAGGAFIGAVIFHVLNFDLFAQGFLLTSLIFTAWVLWKVYRDHLLSQGSPVVREVRADYRQPPELMSRGSRGLPTSFD